MRDTRWTRRGTLKNSFVIMELENKKILDSSAKGAYDA